MSGYDTPDRRAPPRLTPTFAPFRSTCLVTRHLRVADARVTGTKRPAVGSLGWTRALVQTAELGAGVSAGAAAAAGDSAGAAAGVGSAAAGGATGAAAGAGGATGAAAGVGSAAAGGATGAVAGAGGAIGAAAGDSTGAAARAGGTAAGAGDSAGVARATAGAAVSGAAASICAGLGWGASRFAAGVTSTPASPLRSAPVSPVRSGRGPRSPRGPRSLRGPRSPSGRPPSGRPPSAPSGRSPRPGRLRRLLASRGVRSPARSRSGTVMSMAPASAYSCTRSSIVGASSVEAVSSFPSATVRSSPSRVSRR